jgi:hypothetical protein
MIFISSLGSKFERLRHKRRIESQTELSPIDKQVQQSLIDYEIELDESQPPGPPPPGPPTPPRPPLHRPVG